MYKFGMKKIGIIGAGGKTGAMFAFELQKVGKVFGILKEKEFEQIEKEKVFVKREKETSLLKIPLIKIEEFPKGIDFDFLFLAIRNPVSSAVRYYYQKIKEKNLNPPVLFLSQNGIGAVEEAKIALKEVFGKKAKEISIFRISLFNPVDKKISEEKISVAYSLPIRIAISKVSGEKKEKEIFEFFKSANFEVFLIPQKDVFNMEYSKLFLNLIGTACATHSLSILEGFSRKEIFKEEILALREYSRVVKKIGGKFLNFPNYPVSLLNLFFKLPIFLLLPLRKKIAKLIEKEREGKPKDLREIDYYNGIVVKLGEKLGIKAKINKKILKRAKQCLLKE
jgi:ketopantoate reductase